MAENGDADTGTVQKPGEPNSTGGFSAEQLKAFAAALIPYLTQDPELQRVARSAGSDGGFKAAEKRLGKEKGTVETQDVETMTQAQRLRAAEQQAQALQARLDKRVIESYIDGILSEFNPADRELARMAVSQNGFKVKDDQVYVERGEEILLGSEGQKKIAQEIIAKHPVLKPPKQNSAINQANGGRQPLFNAQPQNEADVLKSQEDEIMKRLSGK